METLKAINEKRIDIKSFDFDGEKMIPQMPPHYGKIGSRNQGPKRIACRA